MSHNESMMQTSSIGALAITRICGACLLLSGILGFIAGPIAVRIEYPVFVDFGNAEVLANFAASAPTPFLFCLFQLSLPTLAIASSVGFFYFLRSAGAIVVFGVVLNVVGLVFTTIQDGIEVAIVYYLPTYYVAADVAAQPALLAIGGVGTTAMDVFGRLGTVGYIGLLFISWGMWRLKRGRWIAALYFGVFGLIAFGSVAALKVPALGVVFPIGFIGLRVWMILAALIILRKGPDRGVAAA